jgi:large subunit ribosomal protein L18e
MGTGPTNPLLQALILDLRKQASVSKVDLWARIAEDLGKPTRHRRSVNVSRLARNTAAGETVIVPGKVLGSGLLNHGITVAAWDFSEGARKRITESKGKCLTIAQLLKEKPDAKNVRIIG